VHYAAQIDLTSNDAFKNDFNATQTLSTNVFDIRISWANLVKKL